jgi:hypothetical protein
MPWLSPFPQNLRDVGVGTHANIHTPDHQIVGSLVSETVVFVGGDTPILLIPLLMKHPHRTADQLRQITVDEPGVFTSEFDLTAEAQVITNKDAGSSYDPSGEHLVVAVPEPEDPCVVSVGFTAPDFHQAKIPGAIVRQRMSLAANAEIGRCQRALNGIDELMMWYGMPRRSGLRCVHPAHLIEFDGMSAAVKDEVWVSAFGCCRSMF